MPKLRTSKDNATQGLRAIWACVAIKDQTPGAGLDPFVRPQADILIVPVIITAKGGKVMIERIDNEDIAGRMKVVQDFN